MYRTFLSLCLFAFFAVASEASAQPSAYTIANTHSHNDYEQKIPFWLAYTEGFGSIEADIFLQNGELLVAHEAKELPAHRTLEDLYLTPLQNCIRQHGGFPYADPSRTLQLLIDLKTDSIATLDQLVQTLNKFPALTGCPALRIVITGNRPAPALFPSYPSFIWFDGVLSLDYTPQALEKIAMMSDNFRDYSSWNGKGRVPENEWTILQQAVKKSHRLGKPVRFWGAPDIINAWYHFMRLQVDFINTDHIVALSNFLHTLSATSVGKADANLSGIVPVSTANAPVASDANQHANPAASQPGTPITAGVHSSATGSDATLTHTYRPTYRSDGIDRPVRNVILLIGDGTGLAQLYAGYTANRGKLNIFNIRNIGLSRTSSYDNYITDSAPGSTAFSSGEKTNNRYVGVDHTGAPLKLLPDILAARKIKTGLVTCGDIADATPADFYAHQTERESAGPILRDLQNASIDILMGSGNESLDNVAILKGSSQSAFDPAILKALSAKYALTSSVDSVTVTGNKKWLVVDKRAGLSMLKGRGNWLPTAFDKTIALLSRNQPGFFLMIEGAQVDYGGHANSLPYVTAEVSDFDQVVGKALEFADKDGQTLVIVTADHETGGLTLLDGDYANGYVAGQFATNDHTALPVPVFAYGPRSGLFRGVYENTEIFFSILKALNMAAPKK